MAHNPVLSIFKLKLKPLQSYEGLTFRDFIEHKTSNSYDEGEDGVMILDLFQALRSSLDSDNFIVDAEKFKAFTAYNTQEVEGREATMNPHSDEHVIEGVVEGGRWGQRRGRSRIGDKSQKNDVPPEEIILDQYYFSLYTPLDDDLGVLMIQSYTEATISDVFMAFIRNFFRIPQVTFKCILERFVPSQIIDEWRNGAHVKSYKFSNQFLIPQNIENPRQEDTEEFVIKIEAVSKNGIPIHQAEGWLASFGRKILELGGNNDRPLGQFQNGKIVLQEEGGREVTWNISEGTEIQPVVYLENRIGSEDGVPIFDELKDYCFDLLEMVKNEIYGNDDVQDADV